MVLLVYKSIGSLIRMTTNEAQNELIKLKEANIKSFRIMKNPSKLRSENLSSLRKRGGFEVFTTGQKCYYINLSFLCSLSSSHALKIGTKAI